MREETKYSKVVNGKVHSASIIIESGHFTEDNIKIEIKQNWNSILPVSYPEFTGKGNGVFKVLFNSDIYGIEEIHLTATLENARIAFERMEHYYCGDMNIIGSMEEVFVNNK